MDYKTVKQALSINETVFSTTGEISVDEDFVLPDFYPEVMKILKCKAQARVSSKGINGTSVTLDGHICVDLMYCDKDGKINSFQQLLPFGKSFDSQTDLTGGCITYKIKTDYLNCRAVTERKISVHSAISVSLSVKTKKQHEVIVDIENDAVQTDKNELPFLNVIGTAEKGLLIEQELELSSGQQSVDAILRCEATPLITEIKSVRNKAAVKGNLIVSVLYSSGKQCVPYKSTIPFSQFIDIQGMDEECVCTGKVQLSYLEVKPHNVDGQCRSMSLCAKINVTAQTYCEGEVPIINDAYSTENELAIERNKVNLERVMGHISDNFMVKKTFEFSPDTFGNIIDCWLETEIDNCKAMDENLEIDGNFILCLLVYDADNRISYFEKKSDFSFTKPMQLCCEGKINYEPVIEPVTTSYTILTDSSLEFRVEYRINISLREEKTISFITEVKGEAKEKNKENGISLVMYCARKNERIWDIAKKYNSDINQVREINNLTSDSVECDKQILIPIL
ncbi:MAG: DUF3794 domain-containing protein [Acutalibacteraceae bacterium]|nr:DUF3794 domain-containing protein [Acutalibacteraceae bacterium]